MTEFHFLRPYALTMIIPLLFMVFKFLFSKKYAHEYHDICDEELLPYIIHGSDSGMTIKALIAPTFAIFLLIIALAGPTWKKLPQPLYHERAPTIIVFDLSDEMNLNDVSPTRLDRAKFKLQDFLNHYREGQVGLVVFSSMPFVVSPLSYDSNTIASRVNVLSTDLLPINGRNVGLALEKAEELLRSANEKRGEIIVISAGNIDNHALDVARRIHHNGYQISVLGIGASAMGMLDSFDHLVRKKATSDSDSAEFRFDRKGLATLSSVGGGVYQQLTMDDTDIHHLQNHNNWVVDSIEKENQLVPLWADGGYWFIIFALPFYAYVFRRGLFSLVCE